MKNLATRQDQEFRDHDTGESFDRAALNAELEKIEKPAGISNPKDFRNEIVNFVLRARAANAGKNPAWISYEKLRVVIEKNNCTIPSLCWRLRSAAQLGR